MTARPLLATYRLQLRVDRDLLAAVDDLDHLVDLGVSHVYLAPILQAATASTHGYDVVDTGRVDPALGGDVAFAAFVAAAKARGLGVVVDIVPNHMAADPDHNPWWRDVLRHGRSSRYAGHFDISWDPPDRKLRNQVLVPVLGDHYGRILDQGELVVERQPTELAVRYHDRTFPLALTSSAGLLRGAAAAAPSPALELVLGSLDHLVPTLEAPDGAPDRAIIEAASSVVAECLLDPAVASAVDAAIDEVNAEPERLHEILEAQHYRLARWQTGTDELGYRRFFDVTELVAVRVDQPEVFADTHERIASWIADDLVDGLRVDHPDGLADPAQYFRDLRELVGDRWIVAEKILEHGEELAPWPVDGTTGYELAATVTRAFIDPDGYEELADRITARTDVARDFGEVVRRAKAEVLEQGLAAELRRLTDLLVAVCEAHPTFRDFTRRELRESLVADLACLGVYRTYITPDGHRDDHDRTWLDRMVAEAKAWRPEIDPDLHTLIRASLLGDAPFDGAPSASFRQRFQQLAGAAMAKGKEDTALYRSLVVAAVNEVGADPGRPWAGIAELHAELGDVARRHPATMLTTSTHDTKRSEDVRARLAVLSEIPDAYLAALDRFATALERGPEPGLDPLGMITCFQALVGAHPLPAGRLEVYAEKALREAGVATSWLAPDAAYEQTLHDAVRFVTTDEDALGVVADLVEEILVDGRVNALAQRLVLLTAPGIPDVYQGTELWDLSLVDPDNRRPVDLRLRNRLLRDGSWSDPESPVPGWASLRDPDDPGLAKLALTARALSVRRCCPSSFEPGATYHPILAEGDAADHVIAFGRGDDVAVVVPRLSRRLRDVGSWRSTHLTLPDGTWRDALSPDRDWRGQVPIESLLERVPVALLVRAP